VTSFLKKACAELIARKYAGLYKSKNRISGGVHSYVPGTMVLINYLLLLKKFLKK
jgi:hypothetical protein